MHLTVPVHHRFEVQMHRVRGQARVTVLHRPEANGLSRLGTPLCGTLTIVHGGR
jgi:hypothetical protein